MENPNELSDLKDRIDHLELNARRPQRGPRILPVVLLILILGFGMWAIHEHRKFRVRENQLGQQIHDLENKIQALQIPAPAQENKKSLKLESVEATSFILRDANGKVRGVFGMEERADGLVPVLDLSDPKERLRESLSVDQDGAKILLLDPKGNSRIGLIGHANAYQFEVHDADANLRTVLGDIPAASPDAATPDKRTIPSLIFFDKQKKLVGKMP